MPKSDEFDAKIRDQFQIIHHQAIQAELWSWRHTPEGRLAEIIVLINFLATYIVIKSKLLPGQHGIDACSSAISLQLDAQLNPEQRSFYICHFMHSESKLMHEFALKLFQRLGNEINLSFEKSIK